MRILIHPEQDRMLFDTIVHTLEQAAIGYPDNWEHVKDRPATVDHYGYHDTMVSSVVFSQEPGSAYYRLTLKADKHVVYDALRTFVKVYYGL